MPCPFTPDASRDSGRLLSSSSSSNSKGPRYEKDQLVFCHWRGNLRKKLYPGKVAVIRDPPSEGEEQRYDVLYDDGDYNRDVAESALKPRTADQTKVRKPSER